MRLATIHNLRFVMRLMEEMRGAIIDGTFPTYAQAFLESYRPAAEEVRMAQRERWLASRGNAP